MGLTPIRESFTFKIYYLRVSDNSVISSTKEVRVTVDCGPFANTVNEGPVPTPILTMSHTSWNDGFVLPSYTDSTSNCGGLSIIGVTSSKTSFHGVG